MHENMPLDADELMNLDERINTLPPADADWVRRLFQECLRARIHEAELATELIEYRDTPQSNGTVPLREMAQIALDTAEWLRTLWHVGYMGAGNFPAQPRSKFPNIELEDVLKSSLFARIREGKRPLPFPPPTRHGLPWHELLENEDSSYPVQAEIMSDPQGGIARAIIEGCAQWVVRAEPRPGQTYLVQHADKGPLFRLEYSPMLSTLCRLPPNQCRRILRQERGDIQSYALEWPQDDGSTRHQPLRASTWERAESEAMQWIAANHPGLYGQIRFERVG